MYESHQATGYVIYSQVRSTFLGKLGSWYTDVRLAQVYAEPRSAKMALARSEVSFPAVVVPVKLTVEGRSIEYAVHDAEEAAKIKIDDPKPTDTAPTPAPKPRPKPQAA